MTSKKTAGILDWRLNLVAWQKDLLCCLGLAVALLFLFSSFVFNQQIYPENDNIHFPVINNLTYEYQANTGEIAYWNPNPWGGIPNVFKIPRTMWSLDFYLTFLAELMSLPFVFFLWGAIGMFFFGKHLGFSRMMSVFAALLFVLAPYCKALIIVGHVDKIQALNHLPWVLWSLLLFLKKPKIIHLLFFALTFALELRSNHYQVTFYGAFLMLFLGLTHLWPLFKKRAYGMLISRIGLLAVGGLLALLIASEPFLIAYKNSGRSVRSQQILRLSDEASERRAGVSKKFVERWSFPASELLTLMIPRAKGGLSDDVYPAAHFIGFKDGQVSSYWGAGPFNATYYYVGILVVMLLCFAWFGRYRGPTFWALFASSILMIVWAMGTRLGFFYDLCYAFIPFFKNFRTPSTSLSMLTITLPLLALFGIKSIRDFDFKSTSKPVSVVLGVFALLGIIMLIHAGSADYLKAGEDATTKMVAALQGIRKEMLLMDIYRYLGLIVIGAGLILLYLFGKIPFRPFVLFVLLIAVIDLILVDQRYPFKTISKREFQRTYLDPSPTVKLLQSDQDNFRVLPFSTTNFGLPAHVQTFGGGLDLQMSVNAYEVVTNCLHHKLDDRTQLNWNVLDMMCIKYIVVDRELQHTFLSEEHIDPVQGLRTYRYKFNRPRGYFVDKAEVITDPKMRLQRLNQKQFDARSTAIVERALARPIGPASRSTTEVIHFSPNRVTYNVDASVEGLFVMSDIHAPEAQEIYLDGELVSDIYRTNHLIQSIIVPAGFHTVELRYKDDIYNLSFWLTRISLIICYITLGFLAYREINRKKIKTPEGELA